MHPVYIMYALFIALAIALEKLEDQLNCSICLDTYTNPKQLQCHHIYCQQCLIRLVIQDQQRQLSLTCPSCCQVTLLPASGVAGIFTQGGGIERAKICVSVSIVACWSAISHQKLSLFSQCPSIASLVVPVVICLLCNVQRLHVVLRNCGYDVSHFS